MSNENKYSNVPFAELNAMEKTQLLSWLTRDVKPERPPKTLTPVQRQENARRVEASHAIEEHQLKLAERRECIFEGIVL